MDRGTGLLVCALAQELQSHCSGHPLYRLTSIALACSFFLCILFVLTLASWARADYC